MKFLILSIFLFACKTEINIAENDINLILETISDDIKEYKPGYIYLYDFLPNTKEDMERVVGYDYQIRKLNKLNLSNLKKVAEQGSKDSLRVKFSNLYILENSIYLHAEYFIFSNGILNEERFLYILKKNNDTWEIKKRFSESVSN